MKRLSVVFLSLILLSGILLSSCLKVKDPVPQTYLKVGLVSGLGGFKDAGFNQGILAGLQQIAYDFPMICQAKESPTKADIEVNINYFLANGYNLIITSGYDASLATVVAANANPKTSFLILDYSMASPPSNLLCAVFDVDQSSFPCGFLAAYWALRQSPSNPVAGFVAGTDIPEIRQFSVSYSHGVAYFDSIYNKNVQTLGYFANSFNDTLQGARLADSLLKQNISTIFVFAGKTGNGALYKVKEAGKYAIGVDVDQYYSIPAVGPVLLTSCMKGLTNMTYSIVRSFYYNHFPGGTIVHGTLDNGGVGIAPFHDFDTKIPDSIKISLNNVINGIKNGTIKTGWPGSL
ncbi:MAG: BMP family ABC transporter substrate-binding protein [Bacteroidetes bacterium]|nr:BMP family ABC transporter substrate-binding protein [Bacteroidota bacterium]